MLKRIYLALVLLVFIANLSYSQLQFSPIAPVSTEKANIFFCFNNTKLMAGKNTADRYLIYYNTDTIFLNMHKSGVWTKRIAHTGTSIQSATLSQYKDTIWICWKEGPFIKTRNTPDRGLTWSNVLQVSPGGIVSAPSISASSNGKIHFVWSTATGTSATVFHRSISKGAFVSPAYALSNNGAKGLWPSIITIGDTILCAWKEEPLPSKVWFRSSFNGGNSWNTSALTNNVLSFSKDPNLAYAYHAASKTHYVYLAYDGQNKIYLQRSTNFGNTWTNPELVSKTSKLSQFAHLECNNNGFVGISYEQSRGINIFDDTKKDVGFVFSTAWANSGSFGSDSLAYTKNGFGSLYPALNKIDENNFFLAWLSKDTIANKINIFERRIFFNSTTSVADLTEVKDSDLSIYPNPSNDIVHIDLTNQNLRSIKIYHSSGEIAAVHSSSPFYINTLPAGLYFVVVETNKMTLLRKLVKVQ